MKTAVMSAGGSLINPGMVQTEFLKKLKRLVLESKLNFIIVCGGGSTARAYSAAGKVLGFTARQRDEVGISATMLNAERVRQMFKAPKVMQKPVKKSSRMIVAGGWKPGCSTDYDAVLWAYKNRIDTVINLTNVDRIYTKNPKMKGAQPIKKITWDEYLQLITEKWTPGLSTPFDPVAARAAKKWNLKVVCINGAKLDNTKKYFEGKKFVGTVIK